jgi:hypothetical protein
LRDIKAATLSGHQLIVGGSVISLARRLRFTPQKHFPKYLLVLISVKGSQFRGHGVAGRIHCETACYRQNVLLSSVKTYKKGLWWSML